MPNAFQSRPTNCGAMCRRRRPRGANSLVCWVFLYIFF